MKHFYIYTLVFTFVMASCSDESKEVPVVKWTDESKEYVHSGIDLLYSYNEVSLKFISFVTDISVASNKDWLLPEIENNDSEMTLKITARANITDSIREGVVKLIAGSDMTSITVRQLGIPKAIPDKTIYSTTATGGNITINVKVNNISEKFIAEFKYPEEGVDWAKITNIVPGENTGEYLINLAIDKNEGLGRIFSLRLLVDGETSRHGIGPCIVQEPALFEDTVILQDVRLGSLEVLLGNDLTNLRRIRNLIISGGINDLDFQVIKQLFVNTPDGPEKYPIHLDISECRTFGGDYHLYEKYGWKPSFPEIPPKYGFGDGELPGGIFIGATNLKSIELPNTLTAIHSEAFRECTALKSIKIPKSFRAFGHRVFYGCTALEDINMYDNYYYMSLKSIESQVFDTGTKLKNIYIADLLVEPETLHEYAFYGLSTYALHLQWCYPPEVDIIPDADTLYIPIGTKERYMNTPNWNKFQNIVEEEIKVIYETDGYEFICN